MFVTSEMRRQTRSGGASMKRLVSACIPDECREPGPAQGRRVSYTRRRDAGWSSQVARWAHNPEVAGSNPAPATSKGPRQRAFLLFPEPPFRGKLGEVWTSLDQP